MSNGKTLRKQADIELQKCGMNHWKVVIKNVSSLTLLFLATEKIKSLGFDH
jgi:hypothetical protein